jgi:hypothetical protein
MNRRTFTQTLVSLALVFFLFTPTLMRAFNGIIEINNRYESIAKSTAGASKADVQLIYEEREVEEKGFEQDELFLPLMYVITNAYNQNPSIKQTYSQQLFCFHTLHTPRYLSNRSILI